MTQREPSHGDWSHEGGWPHGEGWGWYWWYTPRSKAQRAEMDGMPHAVPVRLFAALPTDGKDSIETASWKVYRTRELALAAMRSAQEAKEWPMASASDLVIDVRLGLDGPAGEAVAMLREWVAKLGDSGECGRSCGQSEGPCLCGRTWAFLAAIDAATDPKGEV